MKTDFLLVSKTYKNNNFKKAVVSSPKKNNLNKALNIRNKREISVVQWDITGKCNLHCKHCRASELTSFEDLTTEQGLSLLDQIYDLEPQVVNFSGGEPFLRNDLFKLLDYGKNLPLITITTNGLLINDASIKRLKKIRNVRISISLDGLEKNNDELRQSVGAFNKVIKIIDKLTKSSIKTSIRLTLTKYNLNDVLKLYKKISQFPIESFNIRSVIPFGRADISLMPTTIQYKSVINELIKASQKYKVPIISGDPILIPAFPSLLNSNIKNFNKKDLINICSGCMAGEDVVYINPKGIIGTCPFLPMTENCVKNCRIIDSLNESLLFKELNNFKRKLKGNCKHCKYKNLCGGCRAVAFSINNDIFGEDPRCLINNL